MTRPLPQPAAVPTPPPFPGAWHHTRSDAELLHAAAALDHAAMRELYRRHAGPVYALARLDSLQGAEGRVQRAFLAVFRQAGCHARSSLAAPLWILAVSQRSLLTSGSQL